MWHPPESIRHPLQPARWPTAGEAARSRWFSPLVAGRLELHERTWVPAMVPWRATDDGVVTDEVLAWYERFAVGRPGAIVVEATGVRDIPSGPLLRAGDDRFIPGLRELVRTVRRASGGYTRLFIQLIDFLSVKRRPERDKYLRRFLAITPAHREALGLADGVRDEAVRDALVAMPDDRLAAALTPRELEGLHFGYRERVTDTHLPHIRCLPSVIPGVFAAAAGRAEAAGFDGVELHYAHAYTMASFLSALNTRGDGYGGGREGRARLPLETFHAVRSAVSDRFVIGCRYLADECIAGGNTVDDGAYFGVQFAKAGLDYLSLSRGGKFEDAKLPQVGWAVYPYTGPSGWECMPTWLADRRGPDSRSGARGGLRDAGGRFGRHPRLRSGRGDPRARRRRHLRRGTAVARRSRLVSQSPARARRRRPPLHLHELLRRPRPETQAGHVQALGPRGSRRARWWNGRETHVGRQAPAHRAAVRIRARAGGGRLTRMA
jgi:2,4-dienoyl-CoA reductase-like NADH-dependent reductase (Old Yellow Enzyme family)